MPKLRRSELAIALPTNLLITVLFYTWFALRDRYLIFLYFHDMGPGFDTTPFGSITASRYWMSGLVAGGAVMILSNVAHFLLGRFSPSFRPPRRLRLWLLCAAPLLVIIPAIVMTVNDPVLPLGNALQVTAATLIALALAFSLGPIAARHPLAFFLLLADGLALGFVMLLLTAFQFYGRWATGDRAGTYVSVYVAALVASLVFLTAMALPHYVLRRRLTWRPGAPQMFLAACNAAYLFLPLCHHLFFSTDQGTFVDAGYFSYMPDADNYFARNPLLQVAVWLVVGLLALLLARLRARLADGPVVDGLA